ncbi:MAG TPA: ankyrin repeat domain-containing protein, partial [Patescibacteria group bacterium]|nr:ankyrin repeat domain-containing protein [Patescibacteria group bacterium]
KLLRRGASLEYRQSETGDTPLIYAARRDKRSTGSRLVQLGADTRAANNKGETALMLAAQSGMLKLTRDILATRPEINARNQKQETALMIAATKGQSEIATALIKAGADLLLTDAFNKTASARAADSTNYSLRWSLEEAEKLALQKQFENSYKKLRPGG